MSFKPVSVVVCCYNKKKEIEKMLNAVLEQVNLEKGDQVIVSDGKSTDSVEKLIERVFLPDVEFVQVEKRDSWNLQSVRNLGIDAASNDTIIIFDADTIPQPNPRDPSLPNCIDTFRAKSEKGTYLSGLVAYKVPYEQQLKDAKKHQGMARNMIVFKNHSMEEVIKRVEEDSDELRGTIGSGMCFHRDDVYAVGLFDEDYNGCWGYGETDILIKLYLNGVKMVDLDSRTTGMAVSLHQRHKFNQKWHDKCVKRNRAILRGKLPDYREKKFPKVKINER